MKKYIDVEDIRAGKFHFVDREKRDELNTYRKGWNDALDAVADHPPADVRENTRGEWLPDNNNPYETRFICSACRESQEVPTIGFTKYKPLWSYCPYCGAYMQDPEENDGE